MQSHSLRKYLEWDQAWFLPHLLPANGGAVQVIIQLAGFEYEYFHNVTSIFNLMFFFLQPSKMCIGELNIKTAIIIHTVPRWFPLESVQLPVYVRRLPCIYGWKEPSFLGIDLVCYGARVPEVAE